MPPIVLKSFAGGWDRFRLKAAFSLMNYRRLREKHPAHFLVKRSRYRDHETFSGLFQNKSNYTRSKYKQISKSAQMEQEKQQSWRVHFSGELTNISGCPKMISKPDLWRHYRSSLRSEPVCQVHFYERKVCLYCNSPRNWLYKVRRI